MTGRVNPRDRPADAILEALRRANLDYRVTEAGVWAWSATCPACLDESSRTLRISEVGGVGSPINLRCRNRCGEAEVLAALSDALRAARGVA